MGGSYPNGEEIEKTELMQDSDQINISVEEESEQTTDSSSYRRTDPTDHDTLTNHPRSSDREEKTSSSVKTGDSNQPVKYMILAVLSLLVILILSMIYRKSRK